jgi:hypothetical protein
MSSDRTSNGSPRRTIPKKLAVPCEGDDRPDRRLNVLCDDHLPLPVHTTLQLHPRVNVWLDLRGLLAGRQVGAPVVAPGAAAVRIGRTRRGGRFRVRHERQLHERSGKLWWLRHSLLHRRVLPRRLLLRWGGPDVLRDRPTWRRRLLHSERADRSRDRPVPLWRLRHGLPRWDDVLERDVRRRRRRRWLSVTRGPIDRFWA